MGPLANAVSIAKLVKFLVECDRMQAANREILEFLILRLHSVAYGSDVPMTPSYQLTPVGFESLVRWWLS